MCDCLTTLPEQHMTAGDSKNIEIQIYNRKGKPVDATGMKARISISDYVNLNMSPFVTKNCSVIPRTGEQMAVLFVSLAPADTLNLCGKYVYQITGKDADSDFGVMNGILVIHPNRDKSAITSM